MFIKEFPTKVLGKTEEERGLIFKKKVYIVAVLINNNVTTTIKLPFDQYCALQVGQEYLFEMYSHDGETWFFSPRNS